MNDQEIIRKAVELAGWLESDEEGEYLQIPAQPFSSYLDEITAPCDQYLLDALAAQLVRQVDATDKYRVCVQRDCVTVNSYKDGYPTEHGGAIGRDNRTMNTLRAIVESGVLEND